MVANDRDAREVEHQGFCIREPQSADEQAVYYRIQNQETVEAWPANAVEPEPISFYDLWRTTLEHDIQRIDRDATPWNGGETST